MADFTAPDQVVQLGYPPVRFDLITSITGVSLEGIDGNRETSPYPDVTAFFIGRSQLIKNKRLSSRQKDLADLELLGEE